MISIQMRRQLINSLKHEKDKIINYEVSLCRSELLNELNKLEENLKKIKESNKVNVDYRIKNVENKIENYKIQIEHGKTNGTILRNSKGLSIETIKDLKKELKKNDNFILYLQGSYIKVVLNLNE